MKTLFMLILAAVAANSPIWAQSNQAGPIQAGPSRAGSEQYRQAMSAALNSLKTQSDKTNAAEFMALANQFERIAGAEPKEWLPRYYAGLMYVYAGFRGKTETDKDKFLDQADANLKAAEAIAGSAGGAGKDELAVLKAYIAQSRLVVDPMNRWQQYGPLFQAGLEEAKALNANNPRIYALEGSSLMYTPEQFGGGPGAACPILKQAAEKFTQFKPLSDLHPAWGQPQTESMLAKCK